MAVDAALLPYLLVAQGLLGGVDTIFNHELLARLPHKASARTEIGIHSIREGNYALMFFLAAWFACEGVIALLLAGLLLSEIVITAWDEYIENKTRVLPQNERVMHVFLTLNLGVMAAVLVPAVVVGPFAWPRLDAAHPPLLSWALSVLALFAAGWCVRDYLSWRQLRRD